MKKTTQNKSRFNPRRAGTQSRGFSGNNGKQMQDKSGQHAQVIQTKGE
jgi:small acid-soluble spore protein N (minor)